MGWFPPLEVKGNVHARGITDGPDLDLDALRWTVLGAIACARTSVRMMSPYFLPEGELIAFIRTAVMRGVHVEVIVPSRNNLMLVQWASESFFQDLLEAGAVITRTTGHFDHSKVIIVDSAWCLIGSTNLDPRSLRLNFEFNVECYDVQLAADLERLLDSKTKDALQPTLARVRSWSLARRVRNGLVRLFTPYL